MKKVGMILGALIVISLIVVGCSLNDMSNTPTKRTEIFFNKYQTLDSAVLNDLNRVVALDTQFNTSQREVYKEIMKKHYQNLIYKIKDEEIDGDNAVVTVEIEVTDYSSVIRNASTYLEEHPEEFQNAQGEYDVSKYSDYRLEQLKNVDEKVKYTLELNLTKVDKQWQVDQISTVDEEKIHGIYVY